MERYVRSREYGNNNNQIVKYRDVPGSPCFSKTGPVYGPFLFLKFLGSIAS